MSMSRLPIVRAQRASRLRNRPVFTSRWSPAATQTLAQFRHSTLHEWHTLLAQDFSEHFNDSDAEQYEDHREEVLQYLRAVKGTLKVRWDPYDLKLCFRRAHIMAILILYRKHQHLERVIGQYQAAIRARDPALIELLCMTVERVAESFKYKDHRRLHAMHTAAEQAITGNN
jgi:hypothetical protein